MFRIDDPSAATALPVPEAAGTEGYFTEGSPAGGVQATLLRAAWLNMIQEELRAVVVAGGLTPSKTTYNQLLGALQNLFSPGRLLNVRIFTGNGAYTPTAGTKSIIVEAVGGGGGSGGVGATASGATGISSAGSTGAYAKAYLTSGFSSVAVTIGTGGAAGLSSTGGGNGGTTSFGALVSCPGGPGGPPGSVSTGVTNTATGGYASAPSGTGIIETSVGALPANAIQVTAGYATGTVASPSAMPGTNKGQGANGMYNGLSSAAIAGNAGQAGMVIVYEYA